MQQLPGIITNTRAPRPIAPRLCGWIARHRQPLAILGLWLLLAGAAQLYASQQQIAPEALIHQLTGFFRASALGPLLFVAVVALCPLLLLPAAAMGVVGGLTYGPALGTLYTLIGCNISASIVYAIGRCSRRRGDLRAAPAGMMQKIEAQLRRNGFLAVIALRLSFLPYDLVSYVAGLARVRWPSFLMASTIGSLPGLLLIVLAAGSVDLRAGLPQISPALLAGLVAAVAAVAGGAYLIRRRGARAMADR